MQTGAIAFPLAFSSPLRAICFDDLMVWWPQSEYGSGRMDESTVVLNALAQGLRPLGQGVEWFEALSSEEQSEVLRDLGGHCIQARATVEDGP